MTDKLLFDRIDEPGLNTLPVYERRGGYQSLRKAFATSPEDVLKEISDSGLRGRGGAGFRMGQKASFLPHGDMEKYLVCNADESEPGTFKDRELMQKSPHMLIEGMVIGAYAAEINRSFIYIRGEYSYQADILEGAIAEALGAGYIGDLTDLCSYSWLAGALGERCANGSARSESTMTEKPIQTRIGAFKPDPPPARRGAPTDGTPARESAPEMRLRPDNWNQRG